VLGQAAQFEKDKDRYAYEELVFLALLASTRQLTSPVPLLGLVLRNLLDHASDILARLIQEKQEPLICSEPVFRCYSQAGPPYQIRIRGADLAMANVVNALAGPAFAAGDDFHNYQDAAAAFLANYQAAKAAPGLPGAGKPSGCCRQQRHGGSRRQFCHARRLEKEPRSPAFGNPANLRS
jgi:hypothetical protein